jgi:DNA-binding beta-propeller fold protein YncE
VTKVRGTDGVIVGTYTVGRSPSDIVFDGSNIWVACWGSLELVKLRASDGAHLGKLQMQSGPQTLGFDGEKIWVSDDSDSVLTVIRVSDNKIVGDANGGCYPCGGMAFDGRNMWVTAYDAYTVNRLSARDGTFKRPIPVGVQPAGVIFDGTSIWVANQADDTVTKISND